MDIIITNNSDQPIYEQIERQIKGFILSGQLKAGDALPSMRLLAKELRISVITTKRAYDDLTRDGFIETATGRGSFVKSQNAAFLREEKLRVIEGHLARAVSEARQSGVSLEELQAALTAIYEGD